MSRSLSAAGPLPPTPDTRLTAGGPSPLTIVGGDDLIPDPDGALTAPELIEDYLDHLFAPLVGVVPFRERSRLREETWFHLDRLANAYSVEGMSPDDAMRHAIEKYGASREVTERFLESWFVHQAQGYVARRIGLANLRALIWFGLATLLTTFLVQARIFFPNPQPLLFGLSLDQLRRIIPEPLPLPDGSPLGIVFLCLTVSAPLIAGWMTGMTVPVRPARAVYQVQILLTIYTFLFGMLMLPVRDGLFLAVTQLFYWIPLGCLTAHVAAALTWRRHILRS